MTVDGWLFEVEISIHFLARGSSSHFLAAVSNLGMVSTCLCSLLCLYFLTVHIGSCDAMIFDGLNQKAQLSFKSKKYPRSPRRLSH